MAEEFTPVQVRLCRSDLAELDGWRRRQEEIPTRSEAMRILMRSGYQAKKRETEEQAA